MSVEQLNNHYSMTNPASIYDEEALTALELAGRLAKKVVEIVDLVNKNEITIDEAVEQFNKDYNEAITQFNKSYNESKQYMVDNLPDFVENSVESLKNSGDLETMLVNAMLTTKLDKNGVEQVTYEMLSQQVKEMFTGGNTPVVGVDSVSTSNIVNNSVSESKLHPDIREFSYYSNSEQAYYTPLLIIDSTALTATVNPDYAFTFILSSREASSTVAAGTLLVDFSGWTSAPNFDMYFDDSINTIRVVNSSKSTNYSQYYYLGGIRVSGCVATNIVPIQVDGNFYMGNKSHTYGNSPLSIRRPIYYNTALSKYEASNAFFDFDFATCILTMKVTSGKQLFHCEGRYFTMNLATLKTKVDFTTAGSTASVWWNPVSNTLTLRKQKSDANGDYSNELYFGLITKDSSSSASDCIVPYTLSNGAYYIHPEYKTRPLTQLMLTSGVVSGSNMTARIDFKNRRMIIPAHTALTYVLGNQYTHVDNDNAETEIIVPFGSADSNYQYLVGGTQGLKFVGHEEFTAMTNVRDVNQLYYMGYVNEIAKSFDLTFSAERLRTYAVLGDSISTYEGVCPSEHTCYYTGSNAGVTTPQHTWWGRVADRCGLQLACNISRSGLRATPTPSKERIDGFYYASLINDYIDYDPDIIFVYLGINDFNHEVAIGDYSLENTTISYSCTDGMTFAQSYLNMLYSLRMYHPDSHIYCLTLPNAQRTDDTHLIDSVCERNASGVWMYEYNDTIRELCRKIGVNVIDLSACPFTQANNTKYFVDADAGSMKNGFLHPNAEGMKVIANKVIKAVLDTKECD